MFLLQKRTCLCPLITYHNIIILTINIRCHCQSLTKVFTTDRAGQVRVVRFNPAASRYDTPLLSFSLGDDANAAGRADHRGRAPAAQGRHPARTGAGRGQPELEDEDDQGPHELLWARQISGPRLPGPPEDAVQQGEQA